MFLWIFWTVVFNLRTSAQTKTSPKKDLAFVDSPNFHACVLFSLFKKWPQTGIWRKSSIKKSDYVTDYVSPARSERHVELAQKGATEKSHVTTLVLLNCLDGG